MEEIDNSSSYCNNNNDVTKRTFYIDSDNENSSMNFGVRLRRSDSSSKAEDIVNQDEKARLSQPDLPIHKPKDSLLSLTSGFDNFDGVLNWSFLLLSMGGVRLCLENLNKYGILVSPKKWITPIAENFSLGSSPGEYPFLGLILHLHVVVFLVFLVEKFMSRNFHFRKICCLIHLLNMSLMLIIPYLVIRLKYALIGPVKGVIVVVAFSITFLKMWSYIHVNYWCFLARLPNNSQSNIAISSIRRRQPSFSQSNLTETDSTKKTFSRILVRYPHNLTVRDILYFWYAPTLCYELNFPRMNRIRKMFLLRRLLEVIVGVNVIFALIQQWIIPSVVNSLIPFTNMEVGNAIERILKLAIPNHLIWLIGFYLIFHSLFNTLGEILQFADRQFYKDWWNAHNIQVFWTYWNIPVHRWCSRHLYKPLLHAGYSVSFAKTLVFFFSAFFHEYLVSVPLGVIKPYAFIGMMCQLPLLAASAFMQKKFGPRYGNMVVWLSLILGQPLALLMYYHDFVVEHYGEELIESFGRL